MSVPTGPSAPPPSSAKPIWLLLIIICSTIMAAFAVVVLRFLGADLVTTVSAGGAAWLGLIGLGLGCHHFLQ